ncbi:UNVERIFIED_CONTAM: hypothetical protein GTU68_001832 [Idotea baltica]|nr:hypothetical protein [Idotea baltica]
MNSLGSNKEPFVFLISYNQEQNLVESLTENNFQFKFNEFTNITKKTEIASCDLKYSINELFKSQYESAFKKVQEELSLGNSYLTNLTKKIEIKSNLSLNEIFLQANSKYKIYFNNFVSFSPETFIKINNNQIHTFPMKGTIEEKSISSKEELLLNQKEQDEHATIVDLLRNDLTMVAKKVRVEKYRYLTKIKSSKGNNFYQVSTKISGDLDSDYHKKIGSIIYKLLPAGSISGAPKEKTIQIIKEVEDYERGFYTGIAGYFDGENLNSCVLIRFIENIEGKLYFKSGGGITHQSNFNDEFNELLGKVYVPVS